MPKRTIPKDSDGGSVQKKGKVSAKVSTARKSSRLASRRTSENSAAAKTLNSPPRRGPDLDEAVPGDLGEPEEPVDQPEPTPLNLPLLALAPLIENLNKYIILNGPVSNLSPKQAILSALWILGFRNVDIDAIFPMTSWSKSMFGTSAGVYFSFVVAPELGNQILEKLNDPEFGARILEANRVEFAGNTSSYIFLSTPLEQSRIALYQFLTNTREAILKTYPNIQMIGLSASNVIFKRNEQVLVCGLQEMCAEFPGEAKKGMKAMTNMGKNFVKFAAKEVGIPRGFWL